MGFNGFEFGAEGPLNKNSKASFLIDYRYSMVAAIQSLGLSVGTGSATTTHEQLSEAEQISAGVEPGLLRISLGIEHIDDIKNDLKNAFDSVKV